MTCQRIEWCAELKTDWGLVLVLIGLFLGLLPAYSAERQENLALPGLVDIHQMIDECERVVIAGSLGEWMGVRKGRYKHIEFESRSKEFRTELKKWLDPQRWRKIEREEFVTFAAGTLLALDLHFRGDHVRRRVILMSGQLSVGHEAWVEKDVPGPGLDSAGNELAKLLARPEYVNRVVDMSLEEAKACISTNRKPWEDPRFKGIDNDPKWGRQVGN